jgi:hypothetical protein
MNFDTSGSNNLDFSPTSSPVGLLASFVAETTIVRTIIEGSGGPENAHISEAGLRFVRYLLSRSSSACRGVLPNFKDMENIQEMARAFIHQCGGASTALQTMYSITQSQSE